MTQASPMTVEELATRVHKLTVNRASGRPALYQPITLLWAIGRARRSEQRLMTWSDTEQALRDLLERHGMHGERGRPDYPVAALCRAELWEMDDMTGSVPTAHGDTTLRRWFAEHKPTSGLPEHVYILMRDSGFARVAVVNAILESYFQDGDCEELLREVWLSSEELTVELQGARDIVLTAITPQARYARLCQVTERRQTTHQAGRARITDNPVRSAAARRAVLVRCQGRCENPGCTGQPADLTDRGEAILEVDHVHDLAAGGLDHPEHMVALCPNCHAIKTRGRSREALRSVLLQTARDCHAEWMRQLC